MNELTNEEFNELIAVLDNELNTIRKQRITALKQKDDTFPMRMDYARRRLEALLPIKAKLVTMQAKGRTQ